MRRGLALGTERAGARIGPQARHGAVDAGAGQNRLAIDRGDSVGLEALGSLKRGNQLGERGLGLRRGREAQDCEQQCKGKKTTACPVIHRCHPQRGQRR